jgi:hypothetical protein
VLVDALTTDGQLNILDGTLSGPHGVIVGAGKLAREALDFISTYMSEMRSPLRAMVTETRPLSRGGTVDGLLDVLHREVSVAAVNRLEEGNLGVTGKVNVLGAVSD